MNVTFWGTRGSLASAGPDTVRYGGNTACVEVVGRDGTMLVLDAGTGIRRLGVVVPEQVRRVDVLLTHLHMDHVQGLGFFGPLFRADCEVHVWGPRSTGAPLRGRLGRYLSPPLFPVRLRDMDARLMLHELPVEPFQIGGFRVRAAPIIHSGPTVGIRVDEGSSSLAYLPDHEPALGRDGFPALRTWTSGCDLAAEADLLIHDAQYFPQERADRIGWGHSTGNEAAALAALAGARRLIAFHHDPGHDDETIDRLVGLAAATVPGLPVEGAREGMVIEL